MRKIGEDLYASVNHTFAVGASTQQEVDLALNSDEGVVIKQLFTELNVGSAVPSITGAGLTIMKLALYGESQTVPNHMTQLLRLLAIFGFCSGDIAAGRVEWNENGLVPQVPTIPARKLYIASYTANITNAATTIVRVGFRYDRYRLTSQELVELLG